MKKREADMPRSIESQLDELLNAAESEQKLSNSSESLARINYLINHTINDSHIEPYDQLHINEAQQRLSEKLKSQKK